MSEDKTHAPSARRLQKAREEGQVAVSRELCMLVSLGAAGLVMAAQFGSGADLRSWLAGWLQQTSYRGVATWSGLVAALIHGALPAAAAAAAGYWMAGLAQTGLLLHLPALQPSLSRIDPLAGTKRLLGPHALVQLGKAAAKLLILSAACMLVLRQIYPVLSELPARSPSATLALLLSHARAVLLWLLAGQAVIAAADLAWERLRHSRRLRMSFQDLRDEHKESEGNPQVKQRLRQMARSRANRRMMQAIPKSAVVITNPTHYAVALAYQKGAEGAPRVVAKGADDIAAIIREMASTHRVPIVANPPLARALFRVELDMEIPAEHFRAVAEIIAYLWRMRAQALRR